MSAIIQIQSVLDQLKAGKKSLCCNDVKGLLEQLGFEVRDGSRGGHKIYVHDDLPSFKSSSFNCGHGKNPEIKAPYIGKIIAVIKQHHDGIIKYLEK